MPEMLIEEESVLTINPQRKILEDRAVAIKGKQIAEVGKTEELRSKYPNAKNKLIMPSLINTHIHLISFPLTKKGPEQGAGRYRETSRRSGFL